MFVWIESVEAVRNTKGDWILRAALTWAYRSLPQPKSHVCIGLELWSSELPLYFLSLVSQKYSVAIVTCDSCISQQPWIFFLWSQCRGNWTGLGTAQVLYSLYLGLITRPFLGDYVNPFSDLVIFSFTQAMLTKTSLMLISLFSTTHNSLSFSTSHKLFWLYLLLPSLDLPETMTDNIIAASCFCHPCAELVWHRQITTACVAAVWFSVVTKTITEVLGAL